MLTFIILVTLGIALTVILARVIVIYVPKKIQRYISFVLWILIIFLGWKVYSSIMEPINFNKIKIKRYAKVINHLKMIRDAEIAHKRVTGDFTANGNDLIKFIDTAQFAITQNRTIVESVNKGTKWQPIMVDVEKKVIDTIGYDPVKNSFKGRDFSQMMDVPGTNAKFDLKTGYIKKIQGMKIPVFLAQVDKGIVLKGLSKQIISQEKDAVGGTEVKGPTIAVGSLNEVNTNGNWPPKYDKAEKQAAKAAKGR